MSIKLAHEARELEVTSEGLRWAGPSDPDPDAPLLACELKVPLEARAIADVVTRSPIPSTLLYELAARCPPGDDGNADPRWRRARAAAALARGEAASEAHDEKGTPIERGVDAVRVLDDGTLVRLRGNMLAIGDLPPIALPGAERPWYELLTPLTPDAIDPDQVVVLSYNGMGASTLLVFGSSDGRELARIEAPLAFSPNRVARGQAGYWVGNDNHLQLFGGTANVARPYMREDVSISAGWLVDIGRDEVRELGWVSLGTGERRASPWQAKVNAIVRHDDALWCTTKEGLWCLRGGEPPSRVWSGDAYGVAVGGTRAWLGITWKSCVVAIDRATGTELWRTTIGHNAYALYAFEAVIVAVAIDRCTLLAPDGRVLWASDARRDVGVAQLADGTVGVSCGEQVVIVDPAGDLQRALPLPYDGQIFHATADRFLFGRVSGGVDQVPPTATIALDHAGRVTARLVPPDRPAFVGHTIVYAIDYRDGKELRAWDPGGATTGVEPPVPRRPTERGVTHVGHKIVNPREDWPEIGIEVHADFLALDGIYCGTPSSAVPLVVGDAAIATFVRCNLSGGGGGAIAQRAATVILIDCVLSSGPWEIGDACHLVIVGGTVGILRIHAAPTATVTIEGLIARRADNVWIVSSIPYGTPVEIDGTTYWWEKDDESNSVTYKSRGKYVKYIHITSSDFASITFEIPDGDMAQPGWWHREGQMTPEVVARAVAIATRTGSRRLRQLNVDETLEAFERLDRTIEDELACVRATLATLNDYEQRAVFVRCMLAVGCQDTPANRDVVDCWIAVHADRLRAARAGFQLVLDNDRTRENPLSVRSAMAFLVDALRRSAIETGLDTAKADAETLRFAGDGPLPWGIPATHSWWIKAR